MKELIAIVTSHASKYRERAKAQRETWAQHASYCGFDLKFFLGNPPNGEQPRADEVFLDADDGYNGMPSKTRALCKWAREHGYDYIFKTDDDVYVNMLALKQAPHAPHDYVGRFRGASGGYPSDYASGFGYWLSRKAMAAIASAELTEDWAEDRWVANTLAKLGYNGYSDERNYLASYPPVLPENVFFGHLRNASAWCEYPPDLMRRMYRAHMSVRTTILKDVTLRPVRLETGGVPVEQDPAKQPIVYKPTPKSLSNLCILIKTFLRDGYLFDCVAGIRATMPEARMVIIDDGKHTPQKDALYAELRKEGHTCEYMPYDSGFGEKSNYAIQFYDRPYVLIASDDFDFADDGTRHGVEKMLRVLEERPDIAVASGRVDNNPYEAFLYIEDNGETIREVKVQRPDGKWHETTNGVEYKLVDLTVNYSVMRTNVLGRGEKQVCWDGGEVKIGGGEHGAFYLDLKKEGHKVAYVAGANVDTMRYNPRKQDPLYDSMRARARQPGRICLRRRGFKKWILQDGTPELV